MDASMCVRTAFIVVRKDARRIRAMMYIVAPAERNPAHFAIRVVVEQIAASRAGPIVK